MPPLTDTFLTIQDLTSMIANRILEANPGLSDANGRATLDAAIGQIPRLQFGLDVNVKFAAGVTGFEFTEEMAVFDLLDINLAHGTRLASLLSRAFPRLASRPSHSPVPHSLQAG